MWDRFVNRVLERGTLDFSKPLHGYLLKDKADDSATAQPREFNNMLITLALFLSARTDVTEFAVSVNAVDANVPIVNPKLCALWVFFQRKKDHTAFVRWLDKYRKWFTTSSPEKTLFPPFPHEGEHRISLIQSELPCEFQGSYPSDFVDKWAWIIQHCIKPVYVVPQRGFAFTGIKDAIHYKLRWV